MKRLISAAIILATMSTAAFAQGLELTNAVMIEVITTDQNGKEVISYVPADRATPGDTVKYQISYTNTSESSADGVVLTSQIPSAVLLIESSPETETATTEYSVDGGETYDSLADLVVTDAQGNERPAEVADLTNIRWTLTEDVPAGAEGSVSYRATVK